MNVKGIILAGALVVSTSCAAANPIPVLIDIKLVGPKESPHFEPLEIPLQEGEQYIFVIENPYDYPYSFVSDSFPESISTQYIQGSPSVSKKSVKLSPNSKIQWVFRATKGGKHAFHAESYGLQTYRSKVGSIDIAPLLPEKETIQAKRDNYKVMNVPVPTPDYIAALGKQASQPQSKTQQTQNNTSNMRKKIRWGGRP